MPGSESPREGNLGNLLHQLLRHTDRFTTFQKALILLFILAGVSIVLQWLHLCGILVVYSLVLLLSVKLCRVALENGQLYRSDLVLEIVLKVNDGFVSLFQLLERGANDVRLRKDMGPNLKSSPSSSRHIAAAAENSKASEQDSSRHGTGQEENIVNDEIERFLNLVMRDFVQAWYKELSSDPAVLEEINDILYHATVKLAKSRLVNVDWKDLTCDVIQMYHQHLSSVNVCKALLQSRPKRRRTSVPWVASLEDGFQQKFGFHIAMEDREFEMNYIRSLVDIVLVRLLPIDLHRCRIARSLVTEILSCNVLLPVLDMISSPDWIHKAVVLIMSDELVSRNSKTDININGHFESETVQDNNKLESYNRKDLQSNIDSHSQVVTILGSKHCIQGTDMGTTNIQSKVSGDKHEIRKTQSGHELDKLENHSDEPESKLEHSLSHSISKGDKSADTFVTSHLAKHFTLVPHEEITISSNPRSSKDRFSTFRRHSAIGAADLADEADDLLGERPPPNGKAESPVFRDSEHTVLQDITFQLPANEQDARDKKSAMVTASRSQLHSSQSFSIYPCLDSSAKYSSDHHQTLSSSLYIDQKLETIDSSPKKSNEDATCTTKENFGSVLSRFLLFTPLGPSKAIQNKLMAQSLDSAQAAKQLDKPRLTHSRTSSTGGDSGAGHGKNVSFKLGGEDNSLAETTDDDSSSLEHSGHFFSDPIEAKTGDGESDSENKVYEPHENWAHLATNVPDSSEIENALANCMAEDKPNEYRVLETKTCLFHSVDIPSTETITDRGSSSFTVYKIEFEAWYLSESGDIVRRKGSVLRRFREFVNLLSRLEDRPAYKPLLKEVKGPKRWMSLPFGNMDKEAIEGRRKFLEHFLQTVIEKSEICNGPELKEFLAYEGHTHIAFVRKAPEISVPRIDKMFVKTVSGVFDKIATVLPSLTPDVLPSLKKDVTSAVKVSEDGQVIDEHAIELSYGLLKDEQQQYLALFEKFSENYLQRLHEDEMPNRPESGGDQISGSDHGIMDWEDKVIGGLPCRSEGDGSATPDPPVTQSLEERCMSEIPLARSVLDLGAQALHGRTAWVCRETVLEAIQIVVGRAINRWLADQVTELTTSDCCRQYLKLLRETIWPNEKLLNGDEPILTEQDKLATREKAKTSLRDFFPRFLVNFIGAEDFDGGIEELIDSVQNEKINRHFLYTLFDLILERLFPELTNQGKMPQRPGI